MKYRSDFVTNSSSSSYLVYSINSKTLFDIVKSFKEELEKTEENKKTDFDYSILKSLSTDESNYKVIYEDHFYMDNGAETLEDMLTGLLDIFKDSMYSYGYGDYDDNGVFKAFPEYKDKLDLRFISSIEKKQDSILNDIADIYIVSSDIGWGGDDSSRFDPASYDEDMLEQIYENIAKEHGLSIEDVRERDDLFSEYVCNKTSVSETTYKYNFGAQVVEDYYTYTLED